MKLTNAVGVYGNVSRGFRATDGVIEDPTLPFIKVWAYESGVKLDSGGVNATAALFRMDVSNEQTFNPLTSGSSNGGASRHQGVELSLRAPLSKSLTLTGDWTFNDARYKRLIATSKTMIEVDTLPGYACTTRPSTSARRRWRGRRRHAVAAQLMANGWARTRRSTSREWCCLHTRWCMRAGRGRSRGAKWRRGSGSI